MRRLMMMLVMVVIACGMAGNAWCGQAPQDNWVMEPYRQWGAGDLTDIGSSFKVYNYCALAADTNAFYVASYYANTIHVFDPSGNAVTNWGSAGTAPGQFQGPTGVDVDELYVYVADKDNHRVQVFTKDGTYVTNWGVIGTAPGQFTGLEDLAVDAQYVYTCEWENSRIQVFTKDGEFVRTWGETGIVPERFYCPQAVAVDAGYVYVGDSLWDSGLSPFHSRVQVFKKDGTFVRTFDVGAWLQDIAVEGGTIYVTTCGKPYYYEWGTTLSAYDETGELLWQEYKHQYSRDYIGAPNTLWYPQGIAVMNPFVYVIDTGHKNVWPFRRYFRTHGAVDGDCMPLSNLLAFQQRAGTSIVDIDYIVTDRDDPTVSVYPVAFTVNGNQPLSLDDLIPMRSFVDGTESNIGSGVTSDLPHRVSWDMSSDSVQAVIPDYGDIKVVLLSKDQREPLDLHFLHIPAEDSYPAVTISRAPLYESDLLPLWFWLVASDDASVTLTSNKVYGTSGSYENQLLAESTNTTTLGRAMLFDNLGVREANASELESARRANDLGYVAEWDPLRVPPSSGSKVNQVNFVTDPTNGWWVVPLAP